MNKTVLYYSSSRENPEFERRIIESQRAHMGDMPVVSVTQEPIHYGKNICVGDVGLSYLNLYRQQLIGAYEVETEYIVFAESDFLYPQEYFEFEPDGGDCYLYDNVWILHDYKVRPFRKKTYSHGCQIVKRDELIKRLEKGLTDMPEWYDGHPSPWRSKRHELSVILPEYELFSGDIPCVSFKTGKGVSKFTNLLRGKDEHTQEELPHWGHCDKLREKYL